MELDSLPGEIIWNILARVPSLDLIRLRCVCKRWKSIIEEPYFRELQISCSASNPMNNQFLVIEECKRLSFVGLSDERRVVKKELEYCISKYCGGLKYHNGLLCYVDESRKRIIIMNPFTNHRVLLPMPDDIKLPFNLSIYGFVFNPATKYYKVAVFARFLPYRTKFMIFDSESKMWRRIGLSPHIIFSRTLQVLVNERLHWMAKDGMVSFELTNEKFSFVILPSGPLKNRQLMAFDGKLCIVNHRQQGNALQLKIWVMHEYGDEESWVNTFNLEHIIPFEIQTEELRVVLIGEVDNGKVLMICDMETMLFYDLKGGKFRFLGSEELPPINTEEERPTAIHIANLCSIF